MNESLFALPRYMNGVGFEMLGHTKYQNDRYVPPHHPAELQTHPFIDPSYVHCKKIFVL